MSSLPSRSRARYNGGSGHRLGRGPAGHPPGPARPDRVRRPDRDPPGRGDRPAVGAVRDGSRRGRQDRLRRGRRRGPDRGRGPVPDHAGLAPPGVTPLRSGCRQSRPRCCGPPPRIWHRIVAPAIDGPHQGGQCHSDKPLPPRGHRCLTLEICDDNCAGQRGGARHLSSRAEISLAKTGKDLAHDAGNTDHTAGPAQPVGLAGSERDDYPIEQAG